MPPLTQTQAAAAAGLLALAGLHEMHVKTEAGSKFYHEPIGALIVAKHHPHEISEGKHAVYVGAHSWEVPPGTKVYIYSGFDQNDDAEVGAAPKLIHLGPEHGEPGGHFAILAVDGKAEDIAPNAAEGFIKSGHFVPLHADSQKVPVVLGGKVHGWIAPGWHAYYEPQFSSAENADMVFAEHDGHWYVFSQHELHPDLAVHAWPNPATPEQMSQFTKAVKDGTLKPYPVGPSPAPAASVHPSDLKAEVTGIPVTAPQITDAINILTASKSTAVKQPLAKAGHPLSAMDYHAINKAELAAHPELLVPKGSKAAHVGQVKISVLHHLAGKLDELNATHAQQAQAAQAAQEAQHAAEKAQVLTPAAIEVGGIPLTKDELTAAVAALEGTKSTQIKQTLAKISSPLANVDYWKVVNEHKAKHSGAPDVQSMKAKAAFIDALKSAYIDASYTDQESGHAGESHLHELIAGAPAGYEGVDSNSHGFDHLSEAIAAALVWTAKKQKNGSTKLAFHPGFDGKYHYGALVPPGDDYYQVSADGSVSMHLAGKPAEPIAGDAVAKMVEKYLNPPPAPEPPAVPAPAPAAPEVPALSPLQQKAKESLEELLAASEEKIPGGDEDSYASKLAAALTGVGNKPWYVVKGQFGGAEWSTTSTKPSADKKFYSVSPDHSVVLHHAGVDSPVPFALLKSTIAPHLKPVGSKEKGAVTAAEKLHELIGENPPNHPDGSLQGEISNALWFAATDAETYYLIKYPDHFELTLAHPGIGPAYYKIEPNHTVTAVGPDGASYEFPPSATYDLAKPFFAHAQQEAQVLETVHPKLGSGAPESLADAEPGTTFFIAPNASLENPGAVFALSPDGMKWELHVEGNPPSDSVDSVKLDHMIATGQLQEVEPPDAAPVQAPGASAAQLAQDKLHSLVAKGGALPEGSVGGMIAWAMASSMDNAGATRWVYFSDGEWKHKLGSYGPDVTPNQAVYKIVNGTDVTYSHVGDSGSVESEKVGPEELLGYAEAHIVPNATSVQVYVPGEGYTYQLKQYGHYYKPKSPSHLEISHNPDGGAKFTYHSPSGAKVVSKGYASKALADMVNYFPEPKGTKKAASGTSLTGATSGSFATKVSPGPHLFAMGALGKPVEWTPFDLYKDGTAAHTEGGKAHYVSSEAAEALVESGLITDKYGNSLVKPGTKQTGVFLFGKQIDHPYPELAKIKEALETGPSATPLSQVLGISLGSPEHAFLTQFMADHGAVTLFDQKGAAKALLSEMAAAPGDGPKVAEPTFLKGLPPGVASATDVFDFGTSGYAKVQAPFLSTAHSHLGSYSATELKSMIGEISKAYGGGKVVGTHTSSLSKSDLVKWLDSWQAGDMPAVFSLDASGGKVSPVHPGAPKNVGTHTIIWAPWGAGEVPAGLPVEGNWSAPGVVVPKAEVDNYLIKAGLQHAQYLSWQQKRNWVHFHRSGQQGNVDSLSKLAATQWESHANPVTPAPAWTDNIQPAKSYDSFLDEKTAATNWTPDALSDFLSDHAAELDLHQAAANYNSEMGNPKEYSGWKNDYAGKRAVVQHYLDLIKARELAEAAKPRYHTVSAPDGPQHVISDQFGNQYTFTPGAHSAFLTEPAVAGLAHSWGFKTPKTFHVTLEDGKTGLAIERIPDMGTLAGQGIAAMQPAELADIAKEHVLSWALASPYGHAGMLTQLQDGSVVSSSHPGALQHLDWPGLAGDDKADTQAHLAFTELADAIRSHQISKDTADHVAAQAIRAAHRMSQLQDYRIGNAVLAAHGISPDEPGHQDAKALAAALVARKNALPADVTAMWQKIYDAAGWQMPEVKLASLPHGLHSGFSEPSYFDHVIASKSFGAPAFFASPDLARGNFLTWTELAGDNRLIRGEGNVRGPSLAALTEWCQQHQTDGPTGVGNLSVTPTEVSSGVTGESDHYYKILTAAKAVSRHAADQLFEGPHTQSALQGMEDTKQKLNVLLGDAEAALAAGQTSMPQGHPFLVSHMAKYYLGLISKVEDAKANHGTFQPGDLPKWTAPPLPEDPKQEIPEPVKALKVERKTAIRDLGIPATQVDKNSWLLGKEDGELHLSGSTKTYPGEAWHIELPTGEIIEVHDHNITGTPEAHKGRIRYMADASQGSASLERIRAQLGKMGLELPEAAPEDMELLYWRQFAGVLGDRKDRYSDRHKAFWDTLHTEMKTRGLSITPGVGSLKADATSVAHAGLDPQDELAMWRKAGGTIAGSAKLTPWLEQGGYYPHLKHWDMTAPDVTGGKPVWYRHDIDAEWLSSQTFPGHNFSHSERDAVLVARTGGLHSTEARLRVLGTGISGMSSDTDMKSHGSSGVVYTRLNQENGKNVLINPRTLASLHTYSFSGDEFGDTGKRSSMSPFDLKTSVGWSGGSNETNLPDGVSLLDDIEQISATSADQRQQIIDELHARGITSIRGVPVEDRVVTGGIYKSATLDGIKSGIKANPAAMFARAEAYVAPPQEKVSVEHALIETEAVKTAQEGGDLAAKVFDKTVGTDHTLAAAQSAVAQVFYQQPTKPAASEAVSSKVKHDVAERISKNMTVSDSELEALYADAGFSVPSSWGDTKREQSVAAMVNIWAASNSSPISRALHAEAAELFGMPDSMILDKLAGAHASDDAAAKKLRDEHGEVLRDFLRAQYELTQQDFEQAGISHVTLYRIMKWNSPPAWANGHKAGDVIDAPEQRPLVPWAFMQGGATSAGTFGSGTHELLVKTTMPRELLLGYPRSGMGCYNEAEFVAINAPGKWEIVKPTGL